MHHEYCAIPDCGSWKFNQLAFRECLERNQEMIINSCTLVFIEEVMPGIRKKCLEWKMKKMSLS